MKEMRKFIKHISEESLQINIEPKIYYIWSKLTYDYK
jgi:hypothetical protein